MLARALAFVLTTLAIGAGELVEADGAVDVLALQAGIGRLEEAFARQRDASQLAHTDRVRNPVPLEQALREAHPVRRRHQLGIPDEEPHGRVEKAAIEIAASDENLRLTSRHRRAPSSARNGVHPAPRNSETLTDGGGRLQDTRTADDDKAPA